MSLPPQVGGAPRVAALTAGIVLAGNPCSLLWWATLGLV
jgi:hypothetical protein